MNGFEFYFDRPVLGKTLVLPRFSAELFSYEKPWACISINEPEMAPVRLQEANRVDLLRQHYMDSEFPRERLRCFCAEDAQEIWKFVDKVWNKIDLLMVHCSAGVSRSAAVGKAISYKYEQKYINYYDRLFSPNNLIYNILLENS